MTASKSQGWREGGKKVEGGVEGLLYAAQLLSKYDMNKCTLGWWLDEGGVVRVGVVCVLERGEWVVGKAGAIPRGGARHGRYGRRRRRRQRFRGSIGTHIHPILTHTVAVQATQGMARRRPRCLSQAVPSVATHSFCQDDTGTPLRSRRPVTRLHGSTHTRAPMDTHIHSLSDTHMHTI